MLHVVVEFKILYAPYVNGSTSDYFFIHETPGLFCQLTYLSILLGVFVSAKHPTVLIIFNSRVRLQEKKKEIWLNPMTKATIPTYQLFLNIQCKIQKNWCTVTMAPTIEHNGGHSRTLQTRGETRCPGGVSVSWLASRTRHEFTREKGRDLTQSCDKNPYTHRTIQKATWQHKNATKTLITQLLQTDLGRSVGVTTVTQLVWLNNQFTTQPNWCR